MENNQMIITLDDLKKIFTFRTLVIVSIDEYLEDIQNGKFNYLEELHTIDNLLDFEDGCFAIITDEITDKIFRVINIKRWEMMKKSPEINAYINKIISKLNVLAKMPKEKKEKVRVDYFKYIKHKRQLNYNNYYKYVLSFAMDTITFSILDGSELNEVYDVSLIIGSINYLVDLIPDILKSDKVKKRMDEVLAQIEESTKNPYYIYKTKMIKKNLTKE